MSEASSSDLAPVRDLRSASPCAAIVRALHRAEEALPDLLESVIADALRTGEDAPPLKEKTGALRAVAQLARTQQQVDRALGLDRTRRSGKGDTNIAIFGDVTKEALLGMVGDGKSERRLLYAALDGDAAKAAEVLGIAGAE